METDRQQVEEDTDKEQEKLRFKSAMFEGVLDNGQDTIFLEEGSKLTQMMDTLGEMMEETETTSDSAATEDATEQPLQEQAAVESISETELSREENQTSTPASTAQRADHQPATTSPRDLIAQGTAFLSGLAATLKSPEATEKLVESLVETDAETGQTSLKIPVPDKQAVRNLLDIVGKLFG